MGCVCGKPSSAVEDSEFSPKQRELNRKASELRLARGVSSRRSESFSLKEGLEKGDVRVGLIEKKVCGSRKVRDDCCEKRGGGCDDLGGNFPDFGSLPRAVEGEQVAAGWPSWLVAVAGEAIRGWVPRKAYTFEKLDKIGQGTYSSVYKGRDLLTNKYVALKRVRFDNMDPESVKFMAREILILRRLDHPNIIKLEGIITSKTSSCLYLVFEYMEHDLTGLASLPGVKLTEPQVKCYMKQLLSGLDYCHRNGVLHRDIKGSNLLINNHGILKIADFGLASYFDSHNKIPLTSRVVTLWYRPPELLLGATQYGASVDLWSAGCILGELYAGKPIMPGRTEVEQLHKIFKLCGSPSEDYWRKSKLPHSPVFKPIQPYKRRIADTFKDRHDASVRLIEILLSVDPSDRGTAASALESEFFKTAPVPCDPASLPKYPPSKEIDAKLREDEARRKGASGAKGQKGDCNSKKSREFRTVAGHDPKAELAKLMPVRQSHADSNSRSGFLNVQKEDVVSGFAMDQSGREQVLSERSRDRQQKPRERVISNSGPLVSTRNGAPRAECRDSLASQHVEATNQAGRFSQSFWEAVRRHDKRRQEATNQAEYGRINTKETVLDGHGQKERKIHFSGPLLAPSNNIEQVLKEHDRRIQEAARRWRHEKTRGGRVRPHETHPSSYVPTRSAG
ncbi:probable serine/threonine-protein kinase At1g54610 [Salvia hispanica]|uniref:probable serine/threonine-protein kinase At1g54610 n=1 Tax=Salvia hispanica TaxID=49212 RepID=UPI002009943C|nr:probable serine/threonine-protein kinase At1g54610 [Salvia hispanica]